MTDLRIIAGGTALVVLIGLGVWLSQSRYDAGERAAEARMQAKVFQANAETARIEMASRIKSRESSREIETLRAQRDAEADRANRVIKPVRLCPSADGSELPRVADTPSTTNTPNTRDELPVPVGRDIGPALLMLAKSCQRDHDTAVGWQKWQAGQDAIR